VLRPDSTQEGKGTLANEDELNKRIATLEAELAEKNAMLEILMENNPDGICMMDAKGTLRVNRAAGDIMQNHGPQGDGVADEDWRTQHGFFRADRKTKYPVEETALLRAMRGETVIDDLIFLIGPGRPDGVMIASSARPLPGGGAISVFRDVTERMQLEEDLARRNEDLSKREAENKELIERLRVALDELSTPVLEVGEDILVLPVIGVVDSQRSGQMSERLLSEVVRTRSRHVIVDLTGVDIIDTATADRFVKLARAVELLGARCIVCGLQPAVAQTLVELGVQFTGLSTQRNLRHALEACKRPVARKVNARAPEPT
jgi:rsbT co-antagonist protein RsbR